MHFNRQVDYAGGAAVVAKHIRAAGAEVRLSTVLGDATIRLKHLQTLVGFAAETLDVARGLEEEGRRKLQAKGVDLLVVNQVGREGTGFGTETNEATILVADGREVPMRAWSKTELASAVCDLIARFLTGLGVAGRLGRS